MNWLKVLRKIEGKQTVDTIAAKLNIKKTTALNLISKLKKEGYLSKTGGRNQKRIYFISTKKQNIPEGEGMFDIINKYSKLKINPLFMHKTHGRYTVEDALVDAILTVDFRALLASISLFNRISNWPKLYKKTKKYNLQGQLGALYDMARIIIKTRKMPDKMYNLLLKNKPKKCVNLLKIRSKEREFKQIEQKWHVYIPFSKEDLKRLK